MKLSTTVASAAIALALIGATGASADTILNYTFDPGAHYDFSGGPSDPVTGSFSFDVTSQTFFNVNYNRGGDIFTVASLSGPGGSNPNPPTEIFFGDTTTSDYDVYEFATSLDLGGVDAIVGATHPAIVVSASGSISATPVIGGVPEPASWALMILGFGLVGGAVRGRTFGEAIKAAR